VAFDENSVKESWFQELLFRSPSLIPVDEIEPLFGSMVPLTREMVTRVGQIDLVYINARGYLTLVETKLFRNPEARRAVVAQIVDYAAAIAGWSYADLCDAVRKRGPFEHTSANGAPTDAARDRDPVASLVSGDPDYDETRFVDTVSANLARGRFLLLIVGDGIQAGVEHLTQTLAAAPHLGFSLALVELALFKDATGGGLFVQPRVLARSKEIVRAVIELRSPLGPTDVRVTLPEGERKAGGGERRRMTEEAMFETMGNSLGAAIVDQFRAFLLDCEKLGITAEGRDASFSLFWNEPNTGRRFSFASIYAEDGRVSMWFVRHSYYKISMDPSIGLRYVNAVAALVPNAKVIDRNKEGVKGLKIVIGKREITLEDLMPCAPQWIAELRRVIEDTEHAGAATAEREGG
jgi:hypothetical protein